MKKDRHSAAQADELRRKAEERLSAKMPETGLPWTEADLQRLLHELQVHQIELEMQNEELRQAREDAESALERYTDLYDFAPAGYFTLDTKGTIISVNLAGAGLVGVIRSWLVGMSFGMFVSENSRPDFSAFLGKVFASPVNVKCELTLKKEYNSELFVQLEGVAATSGKECRVAMIDITERKQAEKSLRVAMEESERLRLAKESAEETDRAKSLFLAHMSHELRNPMTVILSMLQLTLMEDLAPTLRDYQEMAQRSASRLLRIIDDLLDLAKIEDGKLSIEAEPFSLALCVSEVVDNFIPEVHQKGLGLVLSVAEEIPKTVVGDQLRLQQVLTNLIGNAVKFSKEGQVEVRVSCGVALSGGKREITFAVTDTGIGISEDRKALLFRPFSQGDASYSRRYGGTGLGLSICREIVKLMGGTISFKSEVGTGSSFTFSIPLKEARLESKIRSAPEPLSPVGFAAPGGGRIPRILLVEDDPCNRKAVGALFKMTGYDLEFAEDGLAAIEMCDKYEYDLVFMDINMPGLDGIEATRVIREKERARSGKSYIVALTANAFKEDKDRCLDAGMDGYLSKPVDINKLFKMVEGVIKLKPGRGLA